jgi:hypothetical protein
MFALPQRTRIIVLAAIVLIVTVFFLVASSRHSRLPVSLSIIPGRFGSRTSTLDQVFNQTLGVCFASRETHALGLGRSRSRVFT